MRRRITTLAVTALMAGGLALASAPAQAAPAGGMITCNPAQLRVDAAKTRQAAERAKVAGRYQEWRHGIAVSNALLARAQQCEDSENNNAFSA
ncbi:hypothetical protein AB0M39_31990 [Streptomyces sp. NPDC051907]|uniref:hypothetical protein n=1 Tax=Streptomyces sp. NPDC051907 TaxID=3155284 RepID=UPI00343E98E9